MAKDKDIEAMYKAERKRRIAKRKRERLVKFTENREFRKKSQERMGECRGCGEDPYCYCGSGTPGVIDY